MALSRVNDQGIKMHIKWEKMCPKLDNYCNPHVSAKLLFSNYPKIQDKSGLWSQVLSPIWFGPLMTNCNGIFKKIVCELLPLHKCFGLKISSYNAVEKNP